MGVLQDFERRLEGAVEGFFARAFRSGLQPIELAKAIQRYAEDSQHVTQAGPVVPNVYRIRIHPDDRERLASLGDSLRAELAQVVTRTAQERGWTLRGPATVEVQPHDDVKFGRYEIQGRVEVGDAGDIPPTRRTAPSDPRPLRLNGTAVLVAVDGTEHTLTGPRLTVGRLPTCDIAVDDGTVSREHAALVRRGDQWWVIDLDSTNGTAVGGVTAAEHLLRPGDHIQFGEADLTFEER